MNIVAIVQARVGSSRLRGKVLKLIEDKTMLEHIHDRLKECKNLNHIVIATTTNIEDNDIEKLAIKNNYNIFRGSSDDLLNRYYNTAIKFSADIVVRITADCPLICPKLIDKNIDTFIRSEPDIDILSPRSKDGLMRGLDNEIFSFATLSKLEQIVTDNCEREHVTLHIYNNENNYKILSPEIDDYYKKPYRLCVDEEADLILIKKIYEKLYNNAKIIDIVDVVKLLDNNTDMQLINKFVQQK